MVNNVLINIGSIDFRVNMGFRFNCLGIGGVDFRINYL